MEKYRTFARLIVDGRFSLPLLLLGYRIILHVSAYESQHTLTLNLPTKVVERRFLYRSYLLAYAAFNSTIANPTFILCAHII
ncbi:hypothetical protein CW304_32540 [Bacillus sp. UFRGS-B20]|nr:hypothetical protein CW304_32540 [Bacillus sp. UFRGS-B20]